MGYSDGDFFFQRNLLLWRRGLARGLEDVLTYTIYINWLE